MIGTPILNGHSAYVKLKANSKEPVASWRNGHGALCYNVEEAQRWLEAGNNLALSLENSDYIVIDLDVKNNPDLLDRFVEFVQTVGCYEECRNALRVKTPSGGMHLYFRIPESATDYSLFPATIVNALRPYGIDGVDILIKGYVLLPQSRIGNGTYKLTTRHITQPDQIAELPRFFLSIIRARTRELSLSSQSAMSSGVPIITSHKGGRSSRIWRAIAPYVQQDPVGSVIAWAKSLGRSYKRVGRTEIAVACPYHDDTKPSLYIKWSPDTGRYLVHCFGCTHTVGRTPDELYPRWLNDFALYVMQQHGQTLPSWNEPISYTEEDRQSIKTRMSLKYLRSLDLQQEVLVYYREDGEEDPWISTGRTYLVYGRQKEGKSTIARAICASLSLGGENTNFRFVKSPVLYFAFEEDLHYIRNRTSRLPVDEEYFFVVADYGEYGYETDALWDIKTYLNPDFFERLDEVLSVVQPKCVVLDTVFNLVSAMGLEINNFEQVEAFYRRLNELAARHRCAFLLVGHTAKGERDTKDAVLGSRAWTTRAYGWVHVRKHPNGLVMIDVGGRHKEFTRVVDIDTRRAVVSDFLVSPSHSQPSSTSSQEPNSTPTHTSREAIQGDEDGSDFPTFAESDSSPVFFETQKEADAFMQLPDSRLQLKVDLVSPFASYSLVTGGSDSSDRPLVARLQKPDGIDLPVYDAIVKGRVEGAPHFRGWLLQYLMGQRLYKDLDYTRVPRYVLDIECTGLDPEKDAIRAIGFADAQGHPIVLTVEDTGNEKRLLERFFFWVERTDPKWLVGYNLFGFDLPFILKRAEKHGIRWRWFERHFYHQRGRYRYGSNEEEVDFYHPKSDPERAIIDLYLLALRFDANTGGKLEDYKLLTVYRALTGDHSDYEDDKTDVGGWDVERVRSLLRADLKMTETVLRKLIPAEYYLKEYLPMTFSEILYEGQGRRWDLLLMAHYIGRGLAIVADRPPHEDYEGALVELVQAGVYEPVYKVDVVSLYPSIIVREQIRPRNDYLSLLMRLVDRFLADRLKMKARAKETGDPAAEGQEKALKILINSAYGFLGAENFVFSDSSEAARVTRVGRETIRLMKQYLLEVGAQPIELDTDGIYFTRERPLSEDEETELEDRIGFLVEQERYDKGIFLSAKSYVLVKDGKRTVYGSALRSRGESPVFRQFLRECIDACLTGGSLLAVIDRCLERVQTEPIERLVRRLRANKDACHVKKGERYYLVPFKDGQLYRCRTIPDESKVDRFRIALRLAELVDRFEPLAIYATEAVRVGSYRRYIEDRWLGQSNLFDGEYADESPVPELSDPHDGLPDAATAVITDS